jgi:DNA polymerase IIIc chi subunit
MKYYFCFYCIKCNYSQCHLPSATSTCISHPWVYALLCSLRVCIFYLSRPQLSICTHSHSFASRGATGIVSRATTSNMKTLVHTESPKAASSRAHTSVLTPRAHTSCAWNKFLTRRCSAEREQDALWKLRPTTFIAHTKCVLAANYIQLTFPTNAALYKQPKSKEKQLFTISIRVLYLHACAYSFIALILSPTFPLTFSALRWVFSYNLGCSRDMCAPD